MTTPNPTLGSITMLAPDVFVGRCARYDVTTEGNTYDGAMRRLRVGIRAALNVSRAYHGNIAAEVLVITTKTPTFTRVTTSMLNNEGM